MAEQDNTPVHSQAFGPAEDADSTRQAQHSVSNDAPTDVNLNAVIAREQASTLTVLGKAHVSNQDRRDKIADEKYMNYKAT